MNTPELYDNCRILLSRVRLSVLLAILPILLLLASACASLDTTVSVRQRELPQEYSPQGSSTLASRLTQTEPDTTTIAALRWRDYFQDSLLVALIDTALQSNFTLQMALQRIELARATNTFTKGELLPKVTANASGGVRKFGLYTMDGAGNIATEILPGRTVPIDLPDVYVGVQASWEVDIWGKLRSRNAAAAAQYLSSIEGTRFIATTLIAEVAIAYYELLMLDSELDVLRRTLQKQQEALSVIQLQKEAGKTNELAVQQFEAQVLSTQAFEKEVLQQIVVLENALNALLGRFPQPIVRNKSHLFDTIPQKIASGLPAQLLQNRPDVREAELLLQATKFDTEAAKAAFYPSLSLSAGAGVQAFDPQLLLLLPASLAYNALGGLISPLINWNALEAQFAAAKANQVQAMVNYQKIIVHGFMEVSNELSAIQNLRQVDSLKVLQNGVLKGAVDVATELYKSAKATYLEVLLAQQASLQAQIELVTIKKRQRIALVNVYRALGGGWR